MAKQNVPLYSFNRGEISRFALGRVDAEALRLAAEEQTNFVPMTLGPMMLRPGTRYIGSTKSDGAGVIRPFVFAVNDTALLELTNAVLRIWVNDALIAGNSVSTTITNGDFASATGWTLTVTGGGVATISGGVLTLNEKVRGSSAFCQRDTSVSGGDQNTQHRVRIVVNRGPVAFMVGSASGTDNYFGRTVLGTGTHSIAFTPATNFFVRFEAISPWNAVVESIQVETGTVELTTPWTAAESAVVRMAQSGDIIYCAHEGYQQRQIERRANNSWSITLYEPVGGPYQGPPGWTEGIILTSDTSDGTGVLTASGNLFSANDVNSIIAVERSGVAYTQSIGSSLAMTDSFQVNGVTVDDRTHAITVAGTWVGTVTAYRSLLGPDEGFVAVPTFSTTVNTVVAAIDDSATHANRTTWYRAGFSAYTSGSADVTVANAGGTIHRGQARIIGFTNATTVAIEAFDPFLSQSLTGGIVGLAPLSKDISSFRMADWSIRNGWPSAVEFHDGRLFWGGRDKIWGSISDDFVNFEETMEGDAGPINRSFGYGPFGNVTWLCSLNRLIAGRDVSCVSIRSSNFDAPLTPTDFTMRDCSGHGSTTLPAVKIDKSAVFVDKSGRRVYELRYDIEAQDYNAYDLTELNPDIGLNLFEDIAVQRQPDTRVHLIKGDGKVAVLSYERGKITAWWQIATTSGDEFESVAVLPNSIDDDVYYIVKRTINGGTKRYIEKLARQDQCVGGTTNRQADSHIIYSGVSTSTITGLSHLEGETVVAWGGGADLGSYTVSGGQITLSTAVTAACVGLGYSGRFQSAKLAYAAQMGTALNQKKRAVQIGLILADTHYQGLEIGPDFTTMDFLPKVEDGTTTPADTVWEAYDAPMIPIPGRWSTDSRLCLRATAPRPVVVIAASLGIDTREG